MGLNECYIIELTSAGLKVYYKSGDGHSLYSDWALDIEEAKVFYSTAVYDMVEKLRKSTGMCEIFVVPQPIKRPLRFHQLF